MRLKGIRLDSPGCRSRVIILIVSSVEIQIEIRIQLCPLTGRGGSLTFHEFQFSTALFLKGDDSLDGVGAEGVRLLRVELATSGRRHVEFVGVHGVDSLVSAALDVREATVRFANAKQLFFPLRQHLQFQGRVGIEPPPVAGGSEAGAVVAGGEAAFEERLLAAAHFLLEQQRIRIAALAVKPHGSGGSELVLFDEGPLVALVHDHGGLGFGFCGVSGKHGKALAVPGTMLAEHVAEISSVAAVRIGEPAHLAVAVLGVWLPRGRGEFDPLSGPKVAETVLGNLTMMRGRRSLAKLRRQSSRRLFDGAGDGCGRGSRISTFRGCFQRASNLGRRLVFCLLVH